MSHPLLMETIWFDKPRVDDAERIYQERLGGGSSEQPQSKSGDQPVAKSQAKPVSNVSAKPTSTSSLIDEIARARQQIKNSLQSAPSGTEADKTSNQNIEKELKSLRASIEKLEARVASLENKCGNNRLDSLDSLEARIAALEVGSKSSSQKAPVVVNNANSKPAPAKPAAKNEDDDDIDLFGSEEEDDGEAAKLREKRLEEYAAKKSKKTALVAKSMVIFDVKPWDDETNMEDLEKQVRTIQMDGLLWGASKLVPLAYGIKKLQIGTVVEDDKVSIEELQEKIEEFEDLVQSVDIAAFNKL